MSTIINIEQKTGDYTIIEMKTISREVIGK
jgi:hypothetical protein